jgi:hypothetical protein
VVDDDDDDSSGDNWSIDEDLLGAVCQENKVLRGRLVKEISDFNI